MALIGDPFVGNNPDRKITDIELVQSLRQDIINEYEAIIGYEAHAAATDNENVKKILYTIANQEKVHVGELEQLIYMLAPDDGTYTNKGIKTVKKQQSKNFQAPMQ